MSEVQVPQICINVQVRAEVQFTGAWVIKYSKGFKVVNSITIILTLWTDALGKDKDNASLTKETSQKLHKVLN